MSITAQNPTHDQSLQLLEILENYVRQVWNVAPGAALEVAYADDEGALLPLIPKYFGKLPETQRIRLYIVLRKQTRDYRMSLLLSSEELGRWLQRGVVESQSRQALYLIRDYADTFWKIGLGDSVWDQYVADFRIEASVQFTENSDRISLLYSEDYDSLVIHVESEENELYWSFGTTSLDEITSEMLADAFVELDYMGFTLA